MTLRRIGRLLAVLPVVVAWLGASTAWCFCAPAAPSASSEHACCEDGPGLVPGYGDCCRNAAPGRAAREAALAGGVAPAPAVASSVAPAPVVSLAPPSLPRVVPPAVVLRI